MEDRKISKLITVSPCYGDARPPVISKGELAFKLKVHRKTIERYHNLAVAFIPDYMNCSRDRTGRLASRLPLNNYQEDIVGKILALFKLYRSEELVIRYIKQNSHEFNLGE